MSLKAFSLASFAFAFLALVFSMNLFAESGVPSELLVGSFVLGITLGASSLLASLASNKIECTRMSCDRRFENLIRELDARYIRRRRD